MIPIVFINCSRFPFIAWIMQHLKLYETRTRNTLGSLIGQRVYLAETGKGHPVIRCSAVISSVIECRSQWAWIHWYRHCSKIKPGSQYDWKPETKVKWLYELTDVQEVAPFTPPKDVRHGRVWMEYHPDKILT